MDRIDALTKKVDKLIELVEKLNAQNEPRKKKAIKENIKPQEIIELWNKKGLGRLTEMLPARRKKINSRTKDRLKDLQAWDDYFQMFADSHFLSGGASNWKATFDWALNPTNMMKVIEGNYDNNSGSNGFDPVEHNRRKREEEMKDELA